MQDVEKLHKVHMRAVKMVSGLRNRDYEGRLQECAITSLVDRHARGGHDNDLEDTKQGGEVDHKLCFDMASTRVRD